MSDQQPYTPTFSPRTRTVAYVACLCVPTLVTLVVALLVAFELLDVVVGGVVVAAVGLAASQIAGGLGVSYRPTRSDITPAGTPVPPAPEPRVGVIQ